MKYKVGDLIKINYNEHVMFGFFIEERNTNYNVRVKILIRDNELIHNNSFPTKYEECSLPTEEEIKFVNKILTFG